MVLGFNPIQLVVYQLNTTKIESIDPNSLHDAFEVCDDAIELEFNSINNYFDNLKT